MGLQNGEGHLILGEHIGDGELAAIRVTAVGKIHLSDFVGISLHQNGHAGILQSGDGSVLVGENRHGENHAVILSFVLSKPFGVQQTLVPGLHAAEPGQLGIHHDVVIAGVGYCLDHVVTGTVNQFTGHEAPVAEAKRKSHFLHCDFSFITGYRILLLQVIEYFYYRL